MGEDVHVLDSKILSDDRYLLRKTMFRHRRNDGSWQTLTRETYDRGNGAAILLHDRERRTVLLTRQFRYPAYVNGHAERLIEVVAGMLDEDGPEEAIRREVEEEVGYRIGRPRRLFDAFMSPGAITERLTFFTAPYRPSDRISDGGGLPAEGEDIEVLEMSLDDALAMITAGQIVDAKTIILLLHAKLHGLDD